MTLQSQSLEEFTRLQELAEELNYFTQKYSPHLPYYSQLVSIRESLEQAPELQFPYRFPTTCCQNATRLVSKALDPEFIISELSGGYRFGENLDHYLHHAWNYDPERNIYLDLTLDQFFLEFPPIAIFPSSLPFLKEMYVYTERQRKTKEYLGVNRILAQFKNKTHWSQDK